jgi:hypothetical protein
MRSLLDDRLILGMHQANDIAVHPTVPLQGRPLDPTSQHEEMLVYRMFGTPLPEIIEATQDTLLDEKGGPLADLERTVRLRHEPHLRQAPDFLLH